MVPIITHRNEGKLFTVIGGIILAVVITVLQVGSIQSGKANPLASFISGVFAGGQAALSFAFSGAGNVFGSISSVPHLLQDNARLSARNVELTAENTRLREELSSQEDQRAVERAATAHPGGIVADAIGYDPESQARTVIIDRGSMSGVRPDAGVINEDGIVGRVTRVSPLTSTVLLITDPAGKVPAVVQRGRWWGITVGTNGRVQLQYISQDAPLHTGDLVVTGRGISFQAGLPIGRIKKVYRSEGALYQTALIETAVSFGRLGRVLVLPK